VAIYCDESGGVGAGVMALAAVSLSADSADLIVTRFRDVIGLRGELKGSRIGMAERAFFIETLFRHGGRVIIAHTHMRNLAAASPDGRVPQDIYIYAKLLQTVVDAWLPLSGGCVEMVVDDGRYDARLNGLLRADVQGAIGQWGSVVLADSDQVSGVQIADVLANSMFQIIVGSQYGPRVQTLLDPFIASGAVKLIDVLALDPAPPKA
jgi:hypothetical protein